METPQAYIARLLGLVGDEDPLAILASTPTKVHALLSRANPEAQARRPSPTVWSVTEIVAHLADAELVAGYRLRMILTADGTLLQAFDQDRWASTFDYQSCEARESAHLFAAYRTGTLRVLGRVPTPAMDHHGMHEERGREPVRHLLRLYAGHDRNHLQQIERIVEAGTATPDWTPAPPKPEVPFDLISQLDLRLGTIRDIVEVPDTDRLMQLTVDFGSETRQVIAGIRTERHDPRALVGRQALFYCNLPRRNIRGLASEAMLCDAGHADGLTPALLQPEWPMPDGTRAE